MNYASKEYQEWTRTAKKTLIDKDMTIVKLAEEIKYSKANVTSALNCRYFSAALIKKISDYLGINCPGEEESTA